MTSVEAWLMNVWTIVGGSVLLAFGVWGALSVWVKALDWMLKWCRVHWAICCFIFYRKEFYEWAKSHKVDIEKP